MRSSSSRSSREPGVVLGRVQLRHDDLAVLATGAGDADDAVAGAAVAGHDAAGGDGLVIGMGVDGQQGVHEATWRAW